MHNYQNHPLAGANDLDSAMTKLWAFYKKYFIGMYIISVMSVPDLGMISSGLDLSSLFQVIRRPRRVLEMMKEMACLTR